MFIILVYFINKPARVLVPKAIPRTNTVRKQRLSIWVNVITDVAELLRMFFPGTHISLFQT